MFSFPVVRSHKCRNATDRGVGNLNKIVYILTGALGAGSVYMARAVGSLMSEVVI